MTFLPPTQARAFPAPEERGSKRPVLVIDNYDSFTYNLVQLLASLGRTCLVEPNDSPDLRATLDRRAFGAVVISPGPGRPEDAGDSVRALDAAEAGIPVLGVCLGHQLIALRHGATVRRARLPVHGKTSELRHVGTGIYDGLPHNFSVARYHSLCVDEASLPETLRATAWTQSGELMGVRHQRLPIEGIQFHPESILSQCGRELMRNWLAAAG